MLLLCRIFVLFSGGWMEFSNGFLTDCSQEKSASMYVCKYLNFVLEDDVSDQLLNLYAGKQCQLYEGDKTCTSILKSALTHIKT